MSPPEDAQPGVAVALHDVSPATLAECREMLAMLDEIGATPISLLVVPQFHYHRRFDADDAFVAAMDARRARGDELILHGCYHLDDAPAATSAREWVERRLFTRSEGEFASLDASAAASRLARGVALFRACRWPLTGFVPPAWLLGAGARAALGASPHPFDYVTVRTGIYHLPDWRFEPTANLCYSPDSAWRRAVSRLAIGHELRRARRMPLLRVSLHPQDVRGRGVVDHWRELICAALAERRPVTKGEWVRRVRRQRRRPASPPRPAAARVHDAVSRASEVS